MPRVRVGTIIETWKACGQNHSAAASQLGTHRRTVRRSMPSWRQPWGYVRWQGVRRQSTAPKHPKRALQREHAARVRAWREGTGYCREKLAAVARQSGVAASASTIRRYLQREGLVRPLLRYRRPRFQNGRAMRPANCSGLGYLQMDVKHIEPRLSGLLYTCYEYAAIDIRSRYKLALMLPSLDETGSLLALHHVIQRCPFSLRYVQTDNGLEFQQRFHQKCEELGLEHYYIHKNSPNENAVIERSFRTDEDEFFYWMKEPAKDHTQLNAWYQEYLEIYNGVRPHMGLDMLTPKEAVAMYHK